MNDGGDVCWRKSGKCGGAGCGKGVSHESKQCQLGDASLCKALPCIPWSCPFDVVFRSFGILKFCSKCCHICSVAVYVPSSNSFLSLPFATGTVPPLRSIYERCLVSALYRGRLSDSISFFNVSPTGCGLHRMFNRSSKLAVLKLPTHQTSTRPSSQVRARKYPPATRCSSPPA